MSRTTRAWIKQRMRKAKRMGEVGRRFESEEMPKILEQMQERGLISSYTRHDPNSFSDRHGCDFTVRRGQTERKFGVTISARSWNRARMNHKDAPQFLFPLGTKPETIEKRILSLFN